MPLKVLGGVDAQNAKIINLADPSNPTDAVTKQYTDNLVNGLSFKDEVQAATVTNGTLASAYAAGQVIDGVTLTAGMRILLKNQTTASENGIWVVGAGAPTRSTDADATAELSQATVRVVQGTTNSNTQWTQTATVTTPGTTAQTWVSSGAGLAYTAADDTINISSNAVKAVLKSGAGLSHDGTNGIAIDPTYSGLAKRYAADCAATTQVQTFTHNLGTTDVDPSVRIKATGEVVQAVCTIIDANNVSVDFGSAPTASQYRVFIGA